MALPNAAASATLITPQAGTTVIPKSASASATNLIQQKTHLPNPFELDDPQILDIVYLTHVNDDEICDTKILFDLVSNVILYQTGHSQISLGSYKPEFSTLKLISCQMILTRNAPQCVHQTTLWILQRLRCYSWDAKALITLAAFSLEYGNFVHLLRVPTTDILGSSLKQLNQVQERKVSNDITQLAELIVQAFQLIKQWATWSAVAAYDYEDVPTLTEALHEIPIVVYWTIASIVASTGNLVGVSEYNLQYFRGSLDQAVKRLTNHLESCKMEIVNIDDYSNRRKIYEKPKDIVDRLKSLIHRSGSQGLQIYEGTVQVKMGLEVFKQKNVLLFISSLYSIGDEILLLNALYDRLQENPKDSIKGYRKEDFKILWVPIVDDWDNIKKEQFRTWRNKINNWYSVECFFPLPGIKIIRDPRGLNYEDRPIVPVFNPKGDITNIDAMELIFQWGIDAFPFGEGDGNDLVLKWRWLWDVIKKAAPDLEVHWDRYIFVYGGNSKWVKDFTSELEKVKRREDIKRADVIIQYRQVGEDVKSASSFWIGIERKRQNKKHQVAVDCEIQEIAKSLFCLKRDPQGWAILAKGQNIKILGHGEPMYETLAGFEKWRGKVQEKEGFDVAFKEYYDTKVKEISVRQPCSYLNVDNYTSSVIATITCPNPTCSRVMEVTSVNYKCCHRDDPNNAPFC